MAEGASDQVNEVRPARPNLWGIAADAFSSILLSIYGLLVLGPFGAMAGLGFKRARAYLRALLPEALLCNAIKAGIDWRLGRTDRAIAVFEALTGYVDELLSSREEASAALCWALNDMYALLARAYLTEGQLDDAMLVVLRASASLGTPRLEGLSEIDAKTAQIVRAGIAAGRLLEGGGLAALLVKSTRQTPPAPRARTGKDVTALRPVIKRSRVRPAQSLPRAGLAKVLPFPKVQVPTAP